MKHRRSLAFQAPRAPAIGRPPHRRACLSVSRWPHAPAGKRSNGAPPRSRAHGLHNSAQRWRPPAWYFLRFSSLSTCRREAASCGRLGRVAEAPLRAPKNSPEGRARRLPVGVVLSGFGPSSASPESSPPRSSRAWRRGPAKTDKNPPRSTPSAGSSPSTWSGRAASAGGRIAGRGPSASSPESRSARRLRGSRRGPAGLQSCKVLQGQRAHAHARMGSHNSSQRQAAAPIVARSANWLPERLRGSGGRRLRPSEKRGFFGLERGHHGAGSFHVEPVTLVQWERGGVALKHLHQPG